VHATLGRLSHRGSPSFQKELGEFGLFTGGANRLPFTSGLSPQPATGRSGRYVVFLNGEIYSLFNQKSQHGEFMSDTESFARRVEDVGLIGALEGSDGMFAVIIYDSVTQTVHLARDPVGIKPLYYTIWKEVLYVSSEIKGLVGLGGDSEIHHVEPGTMLSCNLDGVIVAAPFGSNFRYRPHWEPLRDFTEEAHSRSSACLLQLLIDSIKSQTADGKKYAVYLSGGLDSSSVYCIAKNLGIDVRPFVIGLPDSPDVICARVVAGNYGDDLVQIRPPSEEELFDQIPRTVEVCESFEANVVRQSALSRILAREVSAAGYDVALCGEGADELFCGYPDFWEQGFDPLETRVKFFQDLHRTQLKRVDRSNMEQTIEVRVPFLSNDIINLAFSLMHPSYFANTDSGSCAKRLLRSAMSTVLPHDIAQRPKVVFSEGAGLLGNDPQSGLFAQLAKNDFLRNDQMASSREEHAYWGVGSSEEALYLKLFLANGYGRYRSARTRVFANSRKTR
jgi:asparagine synthase (glutamine-hydrolysing)